MEFYEGDPPRHGHRSPAELADDEILSSLRGDFCAMPEAESDDEALAERNRAVPLVLDSGDQPSDAKRGSGSKRDAGIWQQQVGAQRNHSTDHVRERNSESAFPRAVRLRFF